METSINIRSAIASRPLLFTLILLNFIIYGVSLSRPELPALLMLTTPAETVGMEQPVLTTLLRIFTYSLIHLNFGHLAANMLWLLIFGYAAYPLLHTIGFLILYTGGAIAGAIAFLAAATALPAYLPEYPPFYGYAHSPSLCGASAAVIAVAATTLFCAKNITHRFALRIALQFISLSAIVLTCLSGESMLAAMAHTGGFLFGALFGIYSNCKIAADSPDSAICNAENLDKEVEGVENKSNNKNIDRKILNPEVITKVKTSGYASLTQNERNLIK